MWEPTAGLSDRGPLVHTTSDPFCRAAPGVGTVHSTHSWLFRLSEGPRGQTSLSFQVWSGTSTWPHPEAPWPLPRPAEVCMILSSSASVDCVPLLVECLNLSESQLSHLKQDRTGRVDTYNHPREKDHNIGNVLNKVTCIRYVVPNTKRHPGITSS